MATQSGTIILPDNSPVVVTIHPDGTVETNLPPAPPVTPEDEGDD
jgi:hypothetical protein